MNISGIPSIASMSTAEWREQHERDGRVDLWLEDEFNAGSRLVVSLPGFRRAHQQSRPQSRHQAKSGVTEEGFALGLPS